jgi:hypothetical protein
MRASSHTETLKVLEARFTVREAKVQSWITSSTGSGLHLHPLVPGFAALLRQESLLVQYALVSHLGHRKALGPVALQD